MRDHEWRHNGLWVELWVSEDGQTWTYLGCCHDDVPLWEFRYTSVQLWDCGSIEEAQEVLRETGLILPRESYELRWVE